jgi:hypothetical protein
MNMAGNTKVRQKDHSELKSVNMKMGAPDSFITAQHPWNEGQGIQ